MGYHSSPTFADLDGDGDLDAFVGETNGNTILFANTGTASAPAFAPPATNPFGLADVGFEASPTFADLDGDGDLDAFVGNSDGNTVFFANTGTASAPAFAPPAANPFGLAAVAYNASPTFADLDGDGDLDAFVGENDGNTIFFANTGTASAPAFAPRATNPFGLANVGFEASPTFADLDGDGDLDAFVGETYGSTVFFANTGTASAPAFAPPPDNPFGLADVGYNASPTFADLDGDGDLDAFVGETNGNTILFANTGTASAPAFAPPATNPFGLADVGYVASPAFADLDGDGDLDAFVGETYGKTLFFANTGTASAPAFAPPATNPFGLADVAYHASPAFADLDGDGDLDAFVGEYYGSTIFFANTGTASAPAFAPRATNPFGLANVGLNSFPAFADLDGDGDLDAFVGEYLGRTIFFANTGTVSAPALAPPATNPFGLADVGKNAKPAFADLDGDGDLDAWIGGSRGQTFFFERVPCPPAPVPVCTGGFGKGSLLVDERKDGKEKLVAKLSRGPALAQADFGGANGTALALCLYDEADTLAGALGVDRAGELCGTKPCWKPIGKPAGGKGFAYKDKTGSADGVRAVALKGGSAGKSSLSVSASNNAKKAETALPTGIAAALAAATEVTLQLQTGAGCFERTLSEIEKQQSDLFKAK